MNSKTIYYFLSLVVLSVLVLISCKERSKQNQETTDLQTTGKSAFRYDAFRDSLYKLRDTLTSDTENFFDNSAYLPATDSNGDVINAIDSVLSQLKRQDSLSDQDKLALKENLAMLDSFYASKEDTSSGACREGDCGLFAHIIKSRQVMYLYVDGQMKDSFQISTGKKEYSTPVMSMRPRGPVFMKYTSKDYPGGNYKGLGNMPYAVFIKGGYAIHGTTTGNFKKLGQEASHGCIRLHPDNARLFYELVKLFGLKNTWVRVDE